MANTTFNVAKLFVRATVGGDLTVAKLKDAIINDTTHNYKDKIFLCSDGTILCGRDATSVDDVIEYGYNSDAKAQVAALEAILAGFGDGTDEDATVKGYVEKTIEEFKASLKADKVGEVGKFIQSIEEVDGVVTAVAADLNAAAVAATAVVAGDDTVAIDGATVEAQVESIGKAIKTVEKAAATYSIKKVETGLDANVKEAYQLVKTVDGTDTDVADALIPIYKDSSLKDVELVDENDEGTKGQFMKYTYITETGAEKIVYLDCSKFLVEEEFVDGLEVSDAGKVSVKIAADAETFLSVDANGLKLSGVQDAIDTAKADVIGTASEEYDTLGEIEAKVKEAKTEVKNADEDKHILVTSTSSNEDNHTLYTVSSVDIASATTLDSAIAGVGLAADGTHVATTGNYTSAATTVAGEIAALDAQVKTNADAIDTLNTDLASEVTRATAKEKELLEIISTMYDGQKDTVSTVDDVKNNLADVIEQLTNPASFWETYGE